MPTFHTNDVDVILWISGPRVILHGDQYDDTKRYLSFKITIDGIAWPMIGFNLTTCDYATIMAKDQNINVLDIFDRAIEAYVFDLNDITGCVIQTVPCPLAQCYIPDLTYPFIL